jgi:DEAD/DEAH box helicase domain-containing protein
MTVVTPLAPGEHPAGFPPGSGHPAVPGARQARPGGTEAADGSDAPEETAGAASPGPASPAAAPGAETIRRILAEGARSGRLTHVEEIPGRPGELGAWPDWVPAALAAAMGRAGITAPWVHQAAAAGHAHAGRNVIISTGTASGKSVGYLLPALAAAMDGGTVLYIAPTRALAADQLRLVKSLEVPGVRPAVVDGDTPYSERIWARSHANYLLTTPDMLHHTLLPQHARWSGFLRRLRYVIVDECHNYRGVFGSHVAQVLRRLRRIAAYHLLAGHPSGRGRLGGEPAGPAAAVAVTENTAAPPDSITPVFILASATVSEPGRCAWLLTGLGAEAVTTSAASRGPVTFGLWEPPLTALRGEAGAPVRRAATAEAAGLLAELVAAEVPALAFVRSRRGAEAVAAACKRALREEGHGGQAGRVAAYRSGYLPEDRRELEEGLRSGAITALATTTALELGVDITGLEAVLIAGWPGTRAALWQQAGRAGRDGRGAMAVLIARDDPLDTYLVHHPEAILRRPVEATVLDPANPYVLAPHLCAAAAELPLTDADIALFGDGAAAVADQLTERGLLRPRGRRRYPSRRGRIAPVSLRGSGGLPVRIIEEPTGRLVGTVDEPSAHFLAHTGAVYPHQGEIFLVSSLDLDEGVALVQPGDPGYQTSARQLTAIEITAERHAVDWGEARVHFGDVCVTRQVTSYVRRHADSGRPGTSTPLDLPARSLETKAMWWTIGEGQRENLAAEGVDLAGAAHAAEHASIGLLPLVAACDRWDVGGVSADLHPATGQLTVFVYDGHEGGAGFAERGFRTAQSWLRATAEAIASCDCANGCPSCIQSPKCGNGNEPLSKSGAIALLGILLRSAPAG